MVFSHPRELDHSNPFHEAVASRVRGLVEGVCATGEHPVTWNLTNEPGACVPAGLYFARLTVAGRTLVQRIATLE